MADTSRPGGRGFDQGLRIAGDGRAHEITVDKASTIEPGRHLQLDGAYNLRDIGGYPTINGGRTPWRTILRSDSLHDIPAPAQAELIEWGLRTVVDLREASELAERPSVFLHSYQVGYVHTPIFGGRPLADVPLTREDVYRLMIDERQTGIAGAISALAAPGACPALVHCAAGKDRTGLVIALLLGLVGVPDEIIAQDYALSAPCLIGQTPEEAGRRAQRAGLSSAEWQSAMACPPETMLAALRYLDLTYGGVEAYLSAAGVRPEELQTIRVALTEPD